MSAPTLSFGTAQARRSAIGYLRLRLKPAHRSCGFVQGAWWPRTDQLFTELPPLLAALAPRVGSVTTSINTMSVIGQGLAHWFCWSFRPAPTRPARTRL